MPQPPVRNQSPILPPGARPLARARILGGAQAPNLRGFTDFFADGSGVLVITELWGLPCSPAPCAPNIFAIHIHAGAACVGPNPQFSVAGGHFNPNNCPHPAHAGDMPPLFANRGYAFSAFYTERFNIPAVLGKTVVVHSQRDDFTSQPAGDSGARIGCGVIEAVPVPRP